MWHNQGLDDFNGVQPPVDEDGVQAVSAPVSAVNWDDRLDMWEEEEIQPRHQHQHNDGELPLVERRSLLTNNPLRNNLPQDHPGYLREGEEDPNHQLARLRRFEVFREKRKQALIGLSILVASVLVNCIVINMFSVALTAPQFSYTKSNGTKTNVYLWGEGTGGVNDELDPLPQCMKNLYISVLIEAICANVLAVVALLFTGLSCSFASKPWRFTRPLLLLVSSIVGANASDLVFLQYQTGCDGEMRWHRAGAGSIDLLTGAIFCFVLSLAIFAQVSRYPLREVPSWALLVGDYVDEEDVEAEVGVSGATLQNGGDNSSLDTQQIYEEAHGH